MGCRVDHCRCTSSRCGDGPCAMSTARYAKSSTRLDRLALWITNHVGTMGFFLTIFAWTAIWLGWNFLAPEPLQFDQPMSFVFWLFLSNLIQILLMPLIMVGQNIIGRHAEARAEHDLEINVKAEQEIEVILHHLEHQNEISDGHAQEARRGCQRGAGPGKAVSRMRRGEAVWLRQATAARCA